MELTILWKFLHIQFDWWNIPWNNVSSIEQCLDLKNAMLAHVNLYDAQPPYFIWLESQHIGPPQIASIVEYVLMIL